VLNAPGAEALAPFRGRGFRLFWVDATSIAAKHKIGTTTAPIVNSTMVGAVARATGLYAPAVIGPSMDEVLGEKGPRNTAAALEAFEALREVEDGALTAVPAGAN
jgi:Pyruvate/2-oxoacid:ferredoxin oxidoreductase gamma subunit